MDQVIESVAYKAATIPAGDYVCRFRDAELFMGFCRECPNYGRVWACPPFDYDIARTFEGYSHVTVFGAKIEFRPNDLKLEEGRSIVLPVRSDLENRMLRLESLFGGRAFALAGKCRHCVECAKPEGKECRFPDRVRPSLEAAGFDVGKTSEQLLGEKLVWSTDGRLPSRISLVTALFHNADPTDVEREFANPG